jgi:hypothetical protein
VAALGPVLHLFSYALTATPTTLHDLLVAGPSEVTEPGFPLRTGFFGSLMYWVTVYFLGVLKPAEGAALVTTIFIAHAVASDCG